MVIQSLIENCGVTHFNELNMRNLSMDEAYLTISNLLENKSIYLYRQYKMCPNCPLFDEAGPINDNKTLKIMTKYEIIYKVLDEQPYMLKYGSNESVICDINSKYGEFGVYGLEVGGNFCREHTLKEPVNIYLPILTVAAIYFSLCTFIWILKYFIDLFSKSNKTDEIDIKIEAQNGRIKSLDTFRGIAIVIMIFVNYGAGYYNFLEHSIWTGIRVADLAYPWFMWIMGLCIPISINGKIKKGLARKRILRSILKRSCILFFIGIFLKSPYNLKTIVVTGILQRLAFCFLINSFITLMVIKRVKCMEKAKLSKFQSVFHDIIKIKMAWIIMILFLIIHTSIVFLVPFKDCPAGYLGPGGNHDNRKFWDCTGGINGYIDYVILGKKIVQLFPLQVYGPKFHNPNGILGTLPSIVQVFFGVQAGFTLLTFKDHRGRLMRWLIWGAISGILGGLLCNFSADDGVIPLNKNLWSISFMLVTVAFAFMLFSLCYILVDVKKVWTGKPFFYAGMNAIFFYGAQYLAYYRFPINWYVENSNTHFMKLLQNVWSTIMWLLVAYFLYRKNVFLKI